MKGRECVGTGEVAVIQSELSAEQSSITTPSQPFWFDGSFSSVIALLSCVLSSGCPEWQRGGSTLKFQLFLPLRLPAAFSFRSQHGCLLVSWARHGRTALQE